MESMYMSETRLCYRSGFLDAFSREYELEVPMNIVDSRKDTMKTLNFLKNALFVAHTSYETSRVPWPL
jgi:hypothetical protein